MENNYEIIRGKFGEPLGPPKDKFGNPKENDYVRDIRRRISNAVEETRKKLNFLGLCWDSSNPYAKR